MTTYTLTESQWKELKDLIFHNKNADALELLCWDLQPNTQEPCAWMTDDGRVCSESTKDTAMANSSKPSFHIPLYDHPAPQQPLTDKQIIEIAQQTQSAEPGTAGYILPFGFTRAIEAAHNIGVKP